MSRKKKKKYSPLIKYLFTSMLIFTFVMMGLIYFIDILPRNYFFLLSGIIFMVDLVFSVLLFSRKTFLRVFGGLLTTAYILILVLAIIYEINTIDFLKKIGEKEYITLNYNVVVLNTSKYTDIKSIKDEKVGIAKDYIEEVKTKLNKEVKVKYQEYLNYSELADKLLNKNINVIILEDSALAILKEEYDGFDSKISIIYEYSVDVKQKSIKDKVDITNKPFNVYISGIDTYGSINSVSRSDVNMIMTVDPVNKRIIMTSIPRDYYVLLHSKKEYDKLTHAGIYGVEESVSTIEDLLDTKINYYIKVNFTSLVKVVNTLDGIDVDSKYSFKSSDGYNFKKGVNHLDGSKALSFSRERKALPEGDKSRGENQQAVLTAIINKALDENIIKNYNSMLKSLKSSLITNLSNKEITSFVKMQLKDKAKWTIEYINLDGADGYEYTYSYTKSKLYVMIPYEESLNSAKELINSVFEK